MYGRTPVLRDQAMRRRPSPLRRSFPTGYDVPPLAVKK